MALAPMFPTKNRLKVVDFSQHYLNVEATVILRKPPHGVPSRITKVEDLLNQSEIKYGTWDTGIIIRAFRRTNDTLYRIMWRNIQRFSPNAFTDSNDEGIQRVRNEKYAFILPHPIGEYISMQFPCDLITVDKFLLKQKGYSIAVSKGSPLLSEINKQLNIMKQTGYLQRIYHKWWFEGNECGIQTGKMYSTSKAEYNTIVSKALIVLLFLILILK